MQAKTLLNANRKA